MVKSPQVHNTAGCMNFYRIFLLRQEKITAHHEFSAEDDEWARRAAILAFDACADHCDDFELWYGAHLIASRAGLRTRAAIAKPGEASAEAEAAAGQGVIAAVATGIVEAAMKTSAALRDNPKLNAWLSELRRRPER